MSWGVNLELHIAPLEKAIDRAVRPAMREDA